MLKRRQMCTAECAKILQRYNEMRLTSNDQRRHPSPTPKYWGSGLKRLKSKAIGIQNTNKIYRTICVQYFSFKMYPETNVIEIHVF